MADETPKTWKVKYGPLALRVAAYVATWLLGMLAGYLGLPAPPPIVVQVPVDALDEIPPAMPGAVGAGGWIKDDDAIAANLDAAKTLQFAATPAGRAALSADGEVLLYRAVRKAAGRGDDWYPNINQGDVGSCVGAGNKHSIDALQAVQIGNGARAEWRPVSAEAIYGGSRVEIGGGRIRGDGSIGAWAKDWVQRYGVLPMEKLGEHDLTSYSPSRARAWGRSGVPDELEPTAKQHPVKGAALVRTWADVDRAIRQGYPVVVCSDQGFRMERDRDGFCSPRGTWYHCMAILGVKGGARPGGFILNSWGDSAHTGPRYPADAPPAGFWAEADVIDRMVRQGDSFAYSDVTGFPSRKLPDWFVNQPRPDRPRPLLNLFAHSEARLAW